MADAAPMSGVPLLAVSIVVPVKNEAGNIGPLVAEIAAAMAGRNFEIIVVDDGSRDETPAQLIEMMKTEPHLRVVRHTVSCGQSAAVRSGVSAARAPIVATLDGDGQNNPAFIPALIDPFSGDKTRLGLVAGQRVDRQATKSKKWQSRIANEVRRMALKDGTRDSGCGLKAFRRDVFLQLPMFDGLHRFLPALIRREGYDVAFIDVVDRERRHGKSNYGMMDRLMVGLLDLGGVWWLIRRRKHIPSASEVKNDAH